jgi:shikimate dehydrogenase
VPGAVVVNATPVGMKGERLPDGPVEAATGLLDMAYGFEPTPAVITALRLGLPVADGVAMLIGQAVESFRLWTGRAAPEDAMRAELEARPAPAEVPA